MTATMRAARIHGWAQPPVVGVVPAPVCGEGETLVRVEAAAVSHLDVTVAGGDFGIKPDLPYVGGVEGCGVVVESDSLPVGTRVILRGGGLGLKRDGTWAELVTARTRSLSALPEGLTPEIGATFWVPTTTAHAALHDVGRLGRWDVDGVESTSDEVVVVAGAAGAVGSMIVQLALRTGARVIGLVAETAHADAVAPGAEVVVATDEAALATLADERGATLLVDTIGGADLISRSRWVRPGGRAVSIGYVAGNDVAIGLANWLLDDVALLPVNMMRRDAGARAALPELAALLAAGELTMGIETFTLDETAAAVEMLKRGQVRGRAVIVPSAVG